MYKILRLKSGKEKAVKNRHPWVFSGAVQNLPESSNGEIVVVHSIKNEILGYGFYSTESQIVCRLFDFSNEQKKFDNSFWKVKIKKAFNLRKQLIDPSYTNAYRLIHAEGDFFPGLIVDVYGNVAVIQFLIKGVEDLKDLIIEALSESGFPFIYFKNPAQAQNREKTETQSKWMSDRPEGDLIIQENGLKFKVDVEGGQKTGFFIDQRDNRALIGKVAGGKRMLNAFSYTGGFSIYGLSGGASEVHSLDISKDAIRDCEVNIGLNFKKGAAHTGIADDCFHYLRSTQEKYDLIVLDPPAFAKNSRAVDQAAKGYKEVNLQAMRNINSKGILATFSCSQHIDRSLFRKIVFGAAADAGREVKILYQLDQAPDHPVNIFHPEGEYLKGLVLFLE